MDSKFDIIDAYDYHTEEWESLEELSKAFEWRIPEKFNVAAHICDRWVGQDRTALLYDDATTNSAGKLTFEEIDAAASQLANYLDQIGLKKGDRAGVNVPQKRETLISYVALWKMGAVPVPLSTLFGPDGLEHRLEDSQAKIAIVDDSNLESFRQIKGELTSLDQTLVVGREDEVSDTGFNFWDIIESQSDDFETVELDVEDDLILMYTSGTTGQPKGVRHAQRSIIGHMPGIVTTLYNMQINDREVCWSPTEFSWAGTISFIIGAWLYGNPLIAHETGEAFEPEEGFEIIEEYGVNVSLIPPSGLRMMMQVDNPNEMYELDSMRHISSGGEALGSIPEWAEATFSATVNEAYGQTEVWNTVIGDCVALEDARDGWMGFATPGHEIEVLDLETREVLGPGEVGELAIKRDDPTVLKEYWNRPEKTEAKFHEEWALTEDLAERDEQGRFKFVGRTDDVIISSGYRIGPDEVEDSIADHEAVADAGVIGVPDDERGTVPKAFVVLMEDASPSDSLREEIQSQVRDNLAAYEYPRHIEFVEELPRTTTGKVQRAGLREREGIEN